MAALSSIGGRWGVGPPTPCRSTSPDARMSEFWWRAGRGFGRADKTRRPGHRLRRPSGYRFDVATARPLGTGNLKPPLVQVAAASPAKVPSRPDAERQRVRCQELVTAEPDVGHSIGIRVEEGRRNEIARRGVNYFGQASDEKHAKVRCWIPGGEHHRRVGADVLDLPRPRFGEDEKHRPSQP